MLNVCTVSTPDYVDHTLALLYSMAAFRPVRLHCLVSERRRDLEDIGRSLPVENGELVFYALDDIYRETDFEKLPGDRDRLRWTSKSRLMAHLLQSGDIRSLLYLDNDMCFFDDFQFLFDELESHSLLLTPHWRPLDPEVNETQFFCNFRDGLYNAGFLGASVEGLDALNWWHRACLHRCEFDYGNGFFVDQRYLDAFPVYFEGVKILKHLGCNVAQWNADFLWREDKDGRIWINGEWPLVFIHFAGVTIDNIENGTDAALKPQLAAHRFWIEKAVRQISDHRRA
ncbi:hypothetical protein DSCA_06640 [Desulfosarcina alkanivorans]|jgi:hypothetical protein|uniref:Nucleotide-diphospho-sugar transferase domain-containing protein n=1 Tax=Desulfosarcina alkanivorans TaxID=571177 RepID=A0A5K7YK41_9BACT|nr:hypothetical protein [Desulfosarcina alkanivorans]BBO66734.1 hypothetical protein DSCA_06640 [Desulfosarcina alkanivorans]